jgi:hypothetical protein
VGDGAGKRVMECEMCTETDKLGKVVAVKITEVQNMDLVSMSQTRLDWDQAMV